MKYLLDTNVLVGYLRKKVRLREEWVEQGSGISIISLGELIYGAYKSDLPIENLRLIRALVREIGIRIVGMDEEMVDIFGGLKAKLEKRGKKLEDFDLLIAATAISEKLILVTSNVKHFEKIRGLKIEHS